MPSPTDSQGGKTIKWLVVVLCDGLCPIWGLPSGRSLTVVGTTSTSETSSTRDRAHPDHPGARRPTGSPQRQGRSQGGQGLRQGDPALVQEEAHHLPPGFDRH